MAEVAWRRWSDEEANTFGFRAKTLAIAGINYDPLTGEIKDRLVFWGCTYTGGSHGWVAHDGRIVNTVVRFTHWLELPPNPHPEQQEESKERRDG